MTYQELEKKYNELKNQHTFEISEIQKKNKGIIDEYERKLNRYYQIRDISEIAAKTGSWSYNLKTGKIICSDNMAILHGVKPEGYDNSLEMVNKNIHPDDLIEVNKTTEKIIAEKKAYNFNYRVIMPDGNENYIYGSNQLIFDADGEIEELIGLNIDITKQVQAQKTIKLEQERYKNIMDANPSGIYITDKDFNIEYVNPSVLKEFGAVNGRKCHSYFHGLDKACSWCRNKDVFEGKTINWEVLLEKNQKKYLLFDNLIKNPNGTMSNYKIFFDITKQKEIETALLESEAKLRESNLTKDKFFSIIAHDLKSPFNAILGFSEILNDNFDKSSIEKNKEFFSYIYQGIKRAYTLLENLLLWSRMQKGGFDFNPHEENLFLQAEKVLEILKLSADKKDIRLINKISPNISVQADKNMLSLIINNLVSNALKFSYKGGEVLLNASIETNSTNKKFTKITISDSGVGIDSKKQKVLFNLDENTSTKGTGNETGTGLGLILCKEFVEKHGGEIWLESTKNKGSDFNFTIPLLDRLNPKGIN